MSETNNDSFKEEILAEIKRMQLELTKLKYIKKSIVKKVGDWVSNAPRLLWNNFQ